MCALDQEVRDLKRSCRVGGYLGVVDDAIRHQRIDLEFTLRDHLEQSIGTFEVGCPAEETCSESGSGCWGLSSRYSCDFVV